MNRAIDSAVEAILTGKSSVTLPSRRSFPRYSASHPIVLETGEGEQFHGVTLNLCRTGMLARFDEPVATGPIFDITFLPQVRYAPELIECPDCGAHFPTLELPVEPVRGTVVRVERAEPGNHVVAILFEGAIGALGEGQAQDD